MSVILIVDDDKNMRWVLEKALKKEGHQVLSRSDGESGLSSLNEEIPDLVLCDLKMPGMSGLELLEKLKVQQPQVPVIMITGFGSVETAVEAMKLGAADFILKPFDIEAVKLAVNKALGVEKLKDEVRFWQTEAMLGNRPQGIIGSSTAMQELFQTLGQVAPTNATVLILGESGTGKELIARAIHEMSLRQGFPLVKVNCGALPENLLESELFGYEKGAFTGAASRKPGRFERANQGSIFLDEIGEVPPPMQVKLLRVLQEKEIERVGGTETIPVDVRIIAATNRDLTAEVQSGRFREDLYYRLNVVPVHVPPLRDRKEDIPELINAFIEKYGREMGKGELHFTDEAMALLLQYHWPGNIRELQNVVERAVILSTQPFIAPDLLPVEVLKSEHKENDETGIAHSLELTDAGIQLDALEEDLIRQALKLADGNQTKAARLLGITRYTLIYRMEKHGIR